MRIRELVHLGFLPAFLALSLPRHFAAAATPIELAGARVQFVDYDGPAAIAVRSDERHKLAVEITPNSERQLLTLQIDLAHTGSDTWPAGDVAVRDSSGRPVPVRRAGIEWQRLFVTVAAEPETYFVQSVEPPGGSFRILPEESRQCADEASGLRASICRWHGGRKAALSIRFDDSHPTHLSKAIPALREYGFRGTFMINPGSFPAGSRRRSAFQEQKAAWEAVAAEGDQEFANHTSHHQGADTDHQMEREIAEASLAIWAMFPNRSRLLALNLGGGTWWTTTRTLRYYLDKYYLFDGSSGSLGMDDVYGQRVAVLRQHLDRHIERAGWCRIHYHSIGDGEAASEANFRAALDLIEQRKSDLWIAGMADIYKYQYERAGAGLMLEESAADHAVLKLVCSSDVELYDQPLTLELQTRHLVSVTTATGESLSLQLGTTSDTNIFRFDAEPSVTRFVIRW